MNTKNNTGEIKIYKDDNGQNIVDVRLQGETVWLSLDQMATLFGRNKSVISKHLKNAFHELELERHAAVTFFATAGKDKKRRVTRDVEYFNLDIILSVGYKVNSKQGVKFRQWASRVLNEYLLKGYSINRHAVTPSNIKEMEETLASISYYLLHNHPPDAALKKSIADIIHKYERTWSILLEYDDDNLKVQDDRCDTELKDISHAEAMEFIAALKSHLMAKEEASDFFGMERDSMLGSILGNISSTFGGIPLYSSNMTRAAHVLYLIIKDHPFVDGNKRIACALFTYFLMKAKCPIHKLDDGLLIAIALLIAESEPKNKELMVKLIMRILLA